MKHVFPSDKPTLIFTGYKEVQKLKTLNRILSYIETTRKKHRYDWCRILDIGCGRGKITLPLACLGYSIIAVDISRDAIYHAKRKNLFENVCFLCADAENLPLKGKFDIIICVDVFEHLTHPNNLTKELTTLLSEDGVVFITIPNGYGSWELFWEIPLRSFLKIYYKFKRKTIPVGSFHCQNFTLNTLRRLLESNMIVVEEIHNTDFISWLPEVNKSGFANLDCKFSELLPHFLASGWFLICKKSKNRKYLNQQLWKK